MSLHTPQYLPEKTLTHTHTQIYIYTHTHTHIRYEQWGNKYFSRFTVIFIGLSDSKILNG